MKKQELVITNAQEFVAQKETIKALQAKAIDNGHHAPMKEHDSKTAAATLFTIMREITNKTDGAIIGAGVKNRLRCRNENGGYDLVAVHQGGFNFVEKELRQCKYLVYCAKYPDTAVYLVRAKDFINAVEWDEITVSKTERTRQRGFYDLKVRKTQGLIDFLEFNQLDMVELFGFDSDYIREYTLE